MNRGGGDEILLFKQQFRFQELMLLIIEHNFLSKDVYSPAQSVESTVQYIEAHYMENLTVKQLAPAGRGAFMEAHTDLSKAYG